MEQAQPRQPNMAVELALLLVLAKKVADAPVFEQFPQQRMYQTYWTGAEAGVVPLQTKVKRTLFRWLGHLPSPVYWWVLNFWNINHRFRKDMFTRVD